MSASNTQKSKLLALAIYQTFLLDVATQIIAPSDWSYNFFTPLFSLLVDLWLGCSLILILVILLEVEMAL